MLLSASVEILKVTYIHIVSAKFARTQIFPQKKLDCEGL